MSLRRRFGIGNWTDMLTLGPGSVITDLEGLAAVKTPGCPEFRSGNLLILERQPAPQELDRVIERYRRLVGSAPGIAHEMLAWTCEGDDGSLKGTLSAQGFTVEEDIVLACDPREIRPPGPVRGEVEIARARDVGDARALYRLFISGEPMRTRTPEELRFLRYRFASWLKLAAQGRGDGWLAFDEGRPVGGLGLFRFGDIARFQNVFVLSNARRRGIATALVHTAGNAVSVKVKSIVIVAESGTPAERLYRRLGFREVERQVIAWRLVSRGDA